MKPKKIPMRKCMGCMEMFPKRELVRIVKSKTEGESFEIALDLTGKKNGRGAYICKNPDCLKKARKAKRIERALECAIPEEVWEEMERELSKDVEQG